MTETKLAFSVFIYCLNTVIGYENGTHIALFGDKKYDPFSSFADCITRVAKADLFYKTTVLIYNNNRDTADRFTSNLYETMVQELTFNSVPLIITNNLKEFLEYNYDVDGTIINVIITEECEELKALPLDTKNRYILVMNNENMCYKTFKDNREILITKQLTIAYKDHFNRYVFITAVLDMDQNTCNISQQLQFVEVNVCEDGNLSNGETIFQMKFIKNFKECVLNSGLATLHPYMTMQHKEKHKNLDAITESEISGSDVEIVKILAQYLNATLKYYYIFRVEENPYADREFIDLVQNGSLDVCAGGLYHIYDDLVAYSGIYTRQSVIWVYSVEREIRSWQSFVGKVNGLYIFFIFYIIYTGVSKILSRSERHPMPLLESLLYNWGALLGTSSLQEVRSVKQRIVDAMYLIMSLHLSAYLSVQLYSYLTINSPPQLYKTIDQLINSGIKPYLQFASKYFIEDKKYNDFANTSGPCDHFIHCEEVILEKKGTTVVIDGLLPTFQASTAVNDEARVVHVPEEILFVYHEMIIRKDGYFTEPLQRTLLHLFEAGICQKLYDDAIGIIYVDKANIASKNIMSNSYSCQAGCEITLSQSAGAFYIWIIGCLLSCIVFVVEVLLKRERNKLNRNEHK